MTRYSASRRKKDVSGRHRNGESWATCGLDGCRGKRTFSTKKAARNAQRSLRAAHDRAGVLPISSAAEVRPYQCETGGWHIGHDTPRGRPNLNDARLTFLPEHGRTA